MHLRFRSHCLTASLPHCLTDCPQHAPLRLRVQDRRLVPLAQRQHGRPTRGSHQAVWRLAAAQVSEVGVQGLVHLGLGFRVGVPRVGVQGLMHPGSEFGAMCHGTSGYRIWDVRGAPTRLVRGRLIPPCITAPFEQRRVRGMPFADRPPTRAADRLRHRQRKQCGSGGAISCRGGNDMAESVAGD